LALSLAAKQFPPQESNVNQIRNALATSIQAGNASWHPGSGFGAIETARFLQELGLKAPLLSLPVMAPLNLDVPGVAVRLEKRLGMV
jgi:hypothetical protein